MLSIVVVCRRWPTKNVLFLMPGLCLDQFSPQDGLDNIRKFHSCDGPLIALLFGC